MAPIRQVEGYRSYILSRLENLKSLDYKAVHQTEIDDAKEQHQVLRYFPFIFSTCVMGQDDLLEIVEKEEREQKREAAEEEERKNSEQMSKANLADVCDLLENMEKSDTDWQRLKHIPAAAEVWNETKAKFESSSEDFKVSDR